MNMKSIPTRDIFIRITASIATVAMLFVVLVLSAQLVCMNTSAWFRHEYDKYNSVGHVNGEISLDDVVYVSDQTISYCVGDRNSLADVKATIDGEEVNFFTSRELIHLSDCRKLIMSILSIKNWAFVVMAACIVLMIALKADKKTAVRMFYITTAVVIVGAAMLVVMAVSNFDAFFIKFHEMFFNNDYWLLDPYQDEIVNIMQEGMFSDTAALIVVIWAFVVASISYAVKRI